MHLPYTSVCMHLPYDHVPSLVELSLSVIIYLLLSYSFCENNCLSHLSLCPSSLNSIIYPIRLLKTLRSSTSTRSNNTRICSRWVYYIDFFKCSYLVMRELLYLLHVVRASYYSHIHSIYRPFLSSSFLCVACVCFMFTYQCRHCKRRNQICRHRIQAFGQS